MIALVLPTRRPAFRLQLALATLCAFLVNASSAYAVEGTGADLTQYVDPLIGSGGHGHVFVGASVPFGAVQVGLNNPFKGWDWCSAYQHSDDVAIGFSHLHLSGTGIADLGDVLVMPHAGPLTITPGSEYDPEKGYASHYSHDHETAQAGYYAVDLLSSGVRVELTASERVGFHRYTFPKGKAAQVVIDLFTGNGDERATATSLKQLDKTTFAGRRFSTGWADDQRVFFTLVASVAPEKVELLAADGSTAKGEEDACRAILTLPQGTEELLVKVGISPVSEENAQANIAAEIPHWEFGRTVADAKAKWNDVLGSIRVRMRDEGEMRTFYTALYHTMIAPVIFNDASGEYRGADGKTHHADFTIYSVLSLWDSYRAEHPLLTITQPERVNDFVNTFLAIYREQGKLPVWHLMGNETDTMIGYSAAPVIADAYLKGFRGFDAEEAFAAVKASALGDEEGLVHVKERGYIPADAEVESVAKGLEYAIDDGAIAAMADAMGKTSDHEFFAKRSGNYRQYFDPAAGFMRGKLADGSWRTPFDPAASNHRKDDFCEGNAWQYTWLVPQDVPGLIAMLGGPQAFTQKLDGLFEAKADLGEGASADISGLIGQYAHGNEPGHHIPYLYAYAGQQWKTAARVRSILTTLYDDTPAGLCGNEDCGQMSAWYVLSAMGFYPVNPAGGMYVFGSPLIDEATIRLPGGKSFHIRAADNSSENCYIQSAELNGKPFNQFFVTHDQIMGGGDLVLRMAAKPNEDFGSDKAVLGSHGPEGHVRSIQVSASGGVVATAYEEIPCGPVRSLRCQSR